MPKYVLYDPELGVTECLYKRILTIPPLFIYLAVTLHGIYTEGPMARYVIYWRHISLDVREF